MSKLEIDDGKLMVSDGQNNNSDYQLMGFVGTKRAKCGIIYCPYVPVHLSDEEYTKRYLAGKTFAFVKKDYPDDLYANKKCEVLETKDTKDGKMHLLKMDVSYKAVGYVHWVATKPEYEEIWFKEKDIERFLRYGDDGKIIE